MSRILFIAPALSSFVQRDMEALQQHHRVSFLPFRSYPKWRAPFEWIRHKIILLFTIRSYQLIICQFAGYHTFFPVLFGKVFRIPVLIICGGTESVSFPSIGYGNFHKKLLGWFTAFSLRHATHLAPKHHSLMDYNYTYDRQQPAHQGIRAFVKNCSTPFTIIPNGYDEKEFFPSGIKNEKTFLTVATGMELPFTIPLKGIDLIVKAAPHFPECTFTIAGCPENFTPPVTANNIKWVSIQSKSHLLSLYQNHQYYLQLSMSEGFPNAICEAMLCECIPIGSDVNALPDIIGDTGFMIHHRDAEELKSLIHLILKSGTKKPGFEARHRIIRNFSLTNRKEKLLKLADRLIQHENKT